MIFLSPFLDVTRMSMSTVSFLPRLSSTYEERVDKLKSVEVANQFCFENEHRFSI